jgi:hypothetical protein
VEPGDEPPDDAPFGVTCCGTGGPFLLGIGNGLASRNFAGVQSSPAARDSGWVTVSLLPALCGGTALSSAACPWVTIAGVIARVSAKLAKKWRKVDNLIIFKINLSGDAPNRQL